MLETFDYSSTLIGNFDLNETKFLFQTAFCRPDGRVTPLSQRNCDDELFTNLQRHVSELGNWLEYFLIEAAIRREIIDYSRELCDKMLINDPPSFWEEYLFE